MPMHRNIPKLLGDFSTLMTEKLQNLTVGTAIGPVDSLNTAIQYTMSKPGKCMRSFLASLSAQIFGVRLERTLPLCTAIETLHTYSLIHDDLPSMDDAPTRRGQESCHKKFGEAIAILTGDALLTLTFELLSAMEEDCGIRCELIRLMSAACGCRGMVAGQALDMEGLSTSSVKKIKQVHELKTAKLFSAVCEAGAILGQASLEERMVLSEYGMALGMAFQARDDLQDRNEDHGSCNMLHVLGTEETLSYMSTLLNQCGEHLEKLSRDVTILKDLVVCFKNSSI